MWFEFRWWGFILHLNRQTACWAAQSHPDFEKLLNAIPQPWQGIVRAAIAAYKWLFNWQMGVNGLQIHFNWFGVAHWIAPEGTLKPCG